MGVATVRTREPQYEPCFEVPPVTLGPMTGHSYRQDPRRLGIMLARYKFVAKMFEGLGRVAEIGCADAFGSRVVGQTVRHLDLFDFDPVWRDAAIATGHPFRVHDIVADGHLPDPTYDGIYMLDVLEHIRPANEPDALANVVCSLGRAGMFIAGCPSLESQPYASAASKAGHINCRSGDDLRRDMRRYFHNVLLFGQNDEVVHTGFAPMCHYQLVVCCGAREAKSWSK